MSDYETRFGAIGRLYGTAGLARIRAGHVCVIGLGGVGSWVVEALARSGIGALTLVDMDEVCLSNVNRQIHALDGNVGRSKAAVLAERVGQIAPECVADPGGGFFHRGHGRSPTRAELRLYHRCHRCDTAQVLPDRRGTQTGAKYHHLRRCGGLH